MMTEQEQNIFQRTELLIGAEKLNLLHEAKVVIFGVGGVGSWCAESLIRSGIGHLTIVDSDEISLSNVNRQLHATTLTVDMPKVEVLKKRLLAINPDAEINARLEVYDEESAFRYSLDQYDVVIDAIDSLSNKMFLIQQATKSHAHFFSSMGAALKMDPTRIHVAEFWKVNGCPLAAALRRRLRKGEKPSKKFLCVYSDELLSNEGESTAKFHDPATAESAVHGQSVKATANGTFCHITAIFGMTLSGLAVESLITSL